MNLFPRARRQDHVAIYDPVRVRMMVFGGFTDYVCLDDVWALSLSGASEWSKIEPGGTAPAARSSTSAIYDPVRDRRTLEVSGSPSPSNNLPVTNNTHVPSAAGPIPSTRVIVRRK